jgi:hypothetical protein
MGQLLAFGIVHQEGGLAPQVARPPWLSTPVAMLLLLLATTQSCLGPVHTNHQLHRLMHQPAHVQTLIRPPVELGMHITS